jgi:transcription initiation factor TFIID TATA-box-binding protein
VGSGGSVTGLIFQCGKVILTGAKTEDYAKVACKKICKMVNRILPQDEIMPKCFMLRNVVASGNFSSPLKMVEFYLHLKGTNYEWLKKVTFDPSIFPGLRIVTSHFTSTLFASGKFIVTGLKSFTGIEEIYQNLFMCTINYI